MEFRLSLSIEYMIVQLVSEWCVFCTAIHWFVGNDEHMSVSG